MAERTMKEGWSRDEVDKVLDELSPITVPVSISVNGKQKILGLDECERMLRKAKIIGLEPCWCRLKIKGCDAPIDICVTMDEETELAVREREGRKVSLSQAMAALKKGHKAGLVHLAYETPGHDIKAICSCCSCCCHTMYGITQMGMNRDVVGQADVIAVHIPDTCTDCGICVKRCHFKAWSFDEDKVVHNPSLCAGCGVCVSFCPSNSIKMVKRKTKAKRASKSKRWVS
ncbi:MAG TPA: 4Fe-4S binding protein [Thermoplasmata archaeon]